MEGVNTMKMVPVTIVHEDAIMDSIEGIYIQKMADFVVNISNYEQFHLAFIAKDDNNKDYVIETTFQATVFEN